MPPASNQFPEQPIHPQMSEAEFEEIMTRNRTVSSSAIARAVSDAAAGETMRYFRMKINPSIDNLV